MAAPQSAAILSSAQEGLQAAQQAAASAFAAEVTRREEQIDQPDKAHGSKVRTREDRDQSGDHPAQQRRRRTPYEEEAAPASPLGLAGEGEHFIDVTA